MGLKSVEIGGGDLLDVLVRSRPVGSAAAELNLVDVIDARDRVFDVGVIKARDAPLVEVEVKAQEPTERLVTEILGDLDLIVGVHQGLADAVVNTRRRRWRSTHGLGGGEELDGRSEIDERGLADTVGSTCPSTFTRSPGRGAGVCRHRGSRRREHRNRRIGLERGSLWRRARQRRGEQGVFGDRRRADRRLSRGPDVERAKASARIWPCIGEGLFEAGHPRGTRTTEPAPAIGAERSLFGVLPAAVWTQHHQVPKDVTEGRHGVKLTNAPCV